MRQSYNVFISWSGDRSRVIAQKLREWLPRVVQAAKPWMSEADIAKGSKGLNEVTKALSAMKVGITCLTSDNLEAPWLLFEAGALSKTIDDSSRLCTYLIDGVKPEEVKAPLGMFQATRATKADTRKLVQTINASVSDDPLREEDLDEVFEAMWPTLETTIKSLPSIVTPKAVRRNADDMIAEILEIVRAEANRRTPELPATKAPDVGIPKKLVLRGITVGQWDAILARVRDEQRFLAELLEHADGWDLTDSNMTVFFTQGKRSFAELVEGREALTKVRAAATEVLGTPVQVHARLQDS